MASTASSSLLLPLPKALSPVCSSLSPAPRRANARPNSASRRDFLVLTATTSLTAVILPSSAHAKSIPIFGLRKKIEKAEKEAEEIVKEGFETAEKGLEAAEKEVVEVEKEIEEGVFGGLAQAGAVTAAEVFAVLLATTTVKGILGPEPKSS